MAWLKASPIHVEEYLGVALVAHDLPAAADDPHVPLESLLELARADDTDRVVPIEASLPVRASAKAHTGAVQTVVCHVDCRHGAAVGRAGAVVDARR